MAVRAGALRRVHIQLRPTFADGTYPTPVTRVSSIHHTQDNLPTMQQQQQQGPTAAAGEPTAYIGAAKECKPDLMTMSAVPTPLGCWWMMHAMRHAAAVDLFRQSAQLCCRWICLCGQPVQAWCEQTCRGWQPCKQNQYVDGFPVLLEHIPAGSSPPVLLCR